MISNPDKRIDDLIASIQSISSSSTSSGGGQSVDIKRMFLSYRNVNTGVQPSVAGENIRQFNTVVYNEITGGILSNNQIILPVGKYEIEYVGQCFRVNRNACYLRRVSDGSIVQYGVPSSVSPSDYSDGLSLLTANVEVTSGTEAFEVVHVCDQANSNGLGSGGKKISGGYYIYANMEIKKYG